MSSLKDRLALRLAQNTERHAAAKQEAEFDMGRQHVKLNVELIDPNPFQPRQFFSDIELERLAATIAEEGLLQPISVRSIGSRYQIIAGERRWRAHKLLAYTSIEAIVIPANDEQMATWSLSENIEREDLSDYEIGKALQRIQNLFPSKKKLAESVGIVREDMYRYFAFDALPEQLQKKLEANPKLLSRSAMADIKRVLQQHKDNTKIIHLLEHAWDLLEQGNIEQTKIAQFLVQNLKTAEIARSLPVKRNTVKLTRDGNQVGSITHDEQQFLLKLTPHFFTDQQINALHAFVDQLIGEKV